MAQFETIVRPFETPDNSPSTQRYIAANQASSPPIRLRFGRTGSGVTYNYTYSQTTERYLGQYVVEKSR